jgi:metal-dependent amidase/aminoacylase/carboxypeptidase family protein
MFMHTPTISPGEFKSRLRTSIQRFGEDAQKLGQKFFGIAETGFNEVRTEQAICDCLDEWGIPYKNHIARHGVMYSFGTGAGYHIAVLADMDALLVEKEGVAVPFQ